MRQPLVTAPRRDDRKARGARPVHQVADQRRLVAIREAVHDPRFGRLPGEQRPAERVGLDRDVDHVLAVAQRGQDVLDRGDRIARRLDDDVDIRIGDQLFPVFRNGELRGIEADALQVGAGIVRGEVRDANQPHPGGLRQLREIHGRELARPDEADADRVVFSLKKLCVQVQRTVPSREAARRSA